MAISPYFKQMRALRASPGWPEKELTDKQAKLLSFIVEYIAREGCSPTHVEMSEHMGGIADFAVRGHLIRLAAKGWIYWRPNRKARHLRLLRAPREHAKARPAVFVTRGGLVTIAVEMKVYTPDEASELSNRLFEAAREARINALATEKQARKKKAAKEQATTTPSAEADE